MMAFYIKKVKGQLHIDFPYFWCLYSTVTQEQKGDFFLSYLIYIDAQFIPLIFIAHLNLKSSLPM